MRPSNACASDSTSAPSRGSSAACCRWARSTRSTAAAIVGSRSSRSARTDVTRAGGFSPDFSCEDMEVTFRVHRHLRDTGRSYRVLSMPEPVARTEGPDRISTLTRQRARWQRVILETTWHYRRMAFNPRYGSFGLIGIPYCILSEVLAPFVELAALAT